VVLELARRVLTTLERTRQAAMVSKAHSPKPSCRCSWIQARLAQMHCSPAHSSQWHRKRANLLRSARKNFPTAPLPRMCSLATNLRWQVGSLREDFPAFRTQMWLQGALPVSFFSAGKVCNRQAPYSMQVGPSLQEVVRDSKSQAEDSARADLAPSLPPAPGKIRKRTGASRANAQLPTFLAPRNSSSGLSPTAACCGTACSAGSLETDC
jgi:hypothetical protein